MEAILDGRQPKGLRLAEMLGSAATALASSGRRLAGSLPVAVVNLFQVRALASARPDGWAKTDRLDAATPR